MKQFRDMIGCLVLVLMCGASYGEVVATARSPEGKFPEFRVVLDVVKAPRAVANFMGLADGSRTWIDPETKGVRGGAGDAFYDGMVFDWHAGSVLRGGLREVERDGTPEYSGGPGYTLRSEVGASGWNEVEEGSLALVERIPTVDGALIGSSWAGWFGDVFEVDVLHSGGAELGLFLTNGVVPWTVFGQVPEEDLAGLRSLSEAVERGATEVRWEVDSAGMTEGERAALEAARAELPVVRGCETRLTETGVEWDWSGKSRLWYSLSTNLPAGWHHLDLWNEGSGSSTISLPWGNLGWLEPDGSVVALDGAQGFASFAEAEHPAMAGEPLSGKWKIEVKHTGREMRYWLDFNGASDGGTGVWERVEGTNVTETGRVSGVLAARETGNSIAVRFFLGMSIRYYWFGVEEDGATGGRFQEVQIEVGDQWNYHTDSGTYKWTAGWGDGKANGNRRRNPTPFPVPGLRPAVPTERGPVRRGGPATFLPPSPSP